MICIQHDRKSRPARPRLGQSIGDACTTSSRVHRAMNTPLALLTAIATELRAVGDGEALPLLRTARRLLNETVCALGHNLVVANPKFITEMKS